MWVGDGCPNPRRLPWKTHLLFQFLHGGTSQFFRVEPATMERNKDSEAGEGHVADTESKMHHFQNLERG